MRVCVWWHCAPMATLNTISYNVILLSLLIIILTSEASDKVEVGIINSLNVSGSGENLTLHCKSKDDDLGFHTLIPGYGYYFTFRPKPFYRTLFFCGFTWQDEPSLHYLDVYKGYRDKSCGLVSWDIHADGGCKNCDLPSSAKCYPWNKQPSRYIEIGAKKIM